MTERLGEVSVDVSLNLQDSDIQQQLRAILSKNKDEYMSVEMKLDQSEFQEQLNEIKKNTSDMIDFLNQSLSQIGKDFDLNDFEKKYKEKLDAIQAANESITLDNTGMKDLAVQLQDITSLLSSAANELKDFLTVKGSSTNSQAEQSIKDIGDAAKESAEEIREAEQALEDYNKAGTTTDKKTQDVKEHTAAMKEDTEALKDNAQAQQEASGKTGVAPTQSNTQRTDNTADLKGEKESLGSLNDALVDVIEAIDTKSQAFKDERKTVGYVVDDEIRKLHSLAEELNKIIALAEKLGGISMFSLSQSDIDKLKAFIANASAPTQAPAAGQGAKGQSVQAEFNRIAKAYQMLIDSEQNYQQLLYQRDIGSITSKELRELEKLIKAREKAAQLTQNPKFPQEDRDIYNLYWEDELDKAVDSIEIQKKEAIAQEQARAAQEAAANAAKQHAADVKKCEDAYDVLIKTQNKWYTLRDKQNGDNSNLNIHELDEFNTLMAKRHDAYQVINSDMAKNLDMSQKELELENEKARVAKNVADQKAAAAKQQTEKKIKDAYNWLTKNVKTIKDLQIKQANGTKFDQSDAVNLKNLLDEEQKYLDILNKETSELAEQADWQQKIAEKIAARAKDVDKAEQKSPNAQYGTHLFDIDATQDAQRAIMDYLNKTGAAFTNGFSVKNGAKGTTISGEVKTSNKLLEKTKFFVESIGDGQSRVYKNVEKTTSSTGHWENAVNMVGNRLKMLGTYLLSFASWYKAWDAVKYGVAQINELNKQLTEMRKVSDESVESLKAYQKETFGIAKQVGSTAAAIQSSTADYMRLGKSLEEAKQLAKDTTVLMNVSEFTDINDATESMIAMTQAYKELSSGEIVDKLNLIGNNFSISTSDLAQGLQQSASALKTAGNSFEEATALMVAGNSVLQNASSTSRGLRTISLRLIGTDAAREELEQLGEDISDFEVTTSSKMASLIKDLTAVNGKEGISILTDSGNYRSTYEILLDIAKVWKQIKEEDLKTGKNRQEALLEKMAGELLPDCVVTHITNISNCKHLLIA